MTSYNSAVRYLDSAAENYENLLALQDEQNSCTFSEYRNLSRSLGTAVLKSMKEPKSKNQIAVYLKKSTRNIISFMGILYSGNSYVPLDTAMPSERLKKILENLRPEFIITDIEGKKKLEKAGASANFLIYEDIIKTTPDDFLIDKKLDTVLDTDPIYIMYTSGSTGMPKGVVIPHKGIIDYANWVKNTFGLNEKTVIGNQAPFHFDNSTLDIYGSIFSGAALKIIPEVFFRYPVKIPEYLNQEKITLIFFVPTVLINIANSGILETVKFTSLEKVLFCGEVMPNKQLNIWRNQNPDLYYANLYGPTEITDVCTYYEVKEKFKDSDPLPIGKACLNMGTLILTDENKKAAAGEIGELCILGTGLSMGYYKEKTLTEKAFVQNPLNDKYREIIYRTGDLVYETEDGLIMYMGRKDSQIKHKGNRIELGEIETAVKSLDIVDNACVIYNDTKQEIVLFAKLSIEETEKTLLSKLRKLISPYMMPTVVHILADLPLNANGKIDRPNLKKEFFV